MIYYMQTKQRWKCCMNQAMKQQSLSFYMTIKLDVAEALQQGI